MPACCCFFNAVAIVFLLAFGKYTLSPQQILIENVGNFTKLKGLAELVQGNGMPITFIISGQSARPSCSSQSRHAQLAAIRSQRVAMFDVLFHRGFVVSVYLATNNCFDGWGSDIAEAYGPYLKVICLIKITYP